MQHDAIAAATRAGELTPGHSPGSHIAYGWDIALYGRTGWAAWRSPEPARQFPTLAAAVEFAAARPYGIHAHTA